MSSLFKHKFVAYHQHQTMPDFFDEDRFDDIKMLENESLCVGDLARQQLIYSPKWSVNNRAGWFILKTLYAGQKKREEPRIIVEKVEIKNKFVDSRKAFQQCASVTFPKLCFISFSNKQTSYQNSSRSSSLHFGKLILLYIKQDN